ncbi:hypothetical protein ACBY01_01340 [Sphingomonas sp. ac-8]|uniref:hypothetical protein n=1 Tax=Sphingomonas sp. ac-8 TaxID=3242977 RepID=UPI003A7FC544
MLAALGVAVSGCSGPGQPTQAPAATATATGTQAQGVEAHDPGLPSPSPTSTWSAAEQAMIDRWARLNAQCRGGPGDDPATQTACDEREDASKRLVDAGICYGKVGEAGYQMTTHRCDDRSLARQ